MTDEKQKKSDTFSNLAPLSTALPDWVPEIAVTYLSHTALGVPLRQIAREKGVHASTVLRQVRKCEEKREDPLVDQALDAVARDFLPQNPEHIDMAKTPTTNSEAKRILRHLSESGSYLLSSKKCQKLQFLKKKKEMIPARLRR